MRLFSLMAFAMATLISTNAAIADDWVATKLRGVVLTLVDGDWVKLTRGEIVADDRVIRTLRGGRVTFERGAETIDLGGDTQVQIFDRTGKKFTTVKQYFGSVAVEAEVQQVQHFAVQTPYLAAVVKGTRFVVVSGRSGAKVEVKRGRVAVEDRDTHQSTLVTAGQAASSSEGAPLVVSGRGDLPVVFGPNGKPVETKAAEARSAANAGATSPKATEKAANEAAKDEAKEAKSEAKSSGSAASDDSTGGNGGSDNSSNGSGNGNSGNGNSGGDNSGHGNGGGKKDKG